MMIISTILYVIWTFIKTSFQILWPFLLVILIFSIGRVIYRYYRYKENPLSVFKKREEIDLHINVLKEMFLRLDSESTFYQRGDKDLLVITNFGIYLLSYFSQNGKHIEGNLEEPNLIYWNRTFKKEQDRNPFYEQEQIRKAFPSIPIRSYVLLDSYSLFEAKGERKSELISTGNLYYHLEKDKKENPPLSNRALYQKEIEGSDLWQLPKQNS